METKERKKESVCERGEQMRGTLEIAEGDENELEKWKEHKPNRIWNETYIPWLSSLPRASYYRIDGPLTHHIQPYIGNITLV